MNNEAPAVGASPSRLDRELNELLQELRVIQGGILLLIGFLLVIAFSTRFADATEFQTAVYYATLIVTGASAIVVVAPVVHHRLAFRKYDKEAVILRGNTQIIISIVLVAFSIWGIALLITDLIYGPTMDIIVSVAYGIVTVTLWLILPLRSIAAAQRRVRNQG